MAQLLFDKQRLWGESVKSFDALNREYERIQETLPGGPGDPYEDVEDPFLEDPDWEEILERRRERKYW